MAKATLIVTVDLEKEMTNEELNALTADLAFDLKSVARFSKQLHGTNSQVHVAVDPNKTWGGPIIFTKVNS
jgi:hypothetical protein